MKSLTYVYCLVLSGRRPAVSRRLTAIGVPGARDTRAVAAGNGLWLIVASVPADEYDEAALVLGLQNLDWVGRRAMAHEQVIEQFLTARGVLPMQLFTLFTSDERALRHVDRQRAEIVAVIRRLERKLEWGLRLTFDERSIREAVEAGHQRSGRASTDGGRRAPVAERPRHGTAYLARKRDLLDVRRIQLQAARAEADQLFTALGRNAADARRRTSTEQMAPESRLLLDAAFLVPRSRTRTFRAAVKRKTKELGSAGVTVSLTGPWPPYNFISPPKPSTRHIAPARGPRSRRGQAAH